MGVNICDTPDDFTLTDYVSGDPISLSDYNGKAIILSFVSIRCSFCMGSVATGRIGWMRHLQNINSDYETNPDVQVIAVIYNLRDGTEGTHSGPVTPDWIREKLTAEGLTISFPLLMDGPYATSFALQYGRGLGSWGLPHSYMISRDFVITNNWHRRSAEFGEPVSFDSLDFDDTEYFVRHRLEDLQKDRPAWDTVLALDYSDSMNTSVTVNGETKPKIDVLSEAASTLLKVWKDYALCSDRAAWVFFNCDASPGSALSSALSRDHIGNMITAIQTQPAERYTAMGAGLATALDLMEGGTNRKFVVLFTDGIQNRNPLVYVAEISGAEATLIDNIGASDYPEGVWELLECDSDGGQSDYTGGLPVNLDLVDANVHTIGIGAGTSYQNMLNQIALATGGQFRMDVDIWPNLKEFFIEALVEMHRGSSLQLLQKGRGVFAGDQSEVVKTFTLNRSVSKITVLLSWADGQTPLKFGLCKDGMSIDLSHKVKDEPTYQFATLAFPHYQKIQPKILHLARRRSTLKYPAVEARVARAELIESRLSTPLRLQAAPGGEVVSAEGEWELVIRRRFNESESKPAYHYMILADEKNLEFDIEIPQTFYQVGQPIPIAIRLSDKMGSQIRVFSVQAEVIRPTVTLAEVLAKKQIEVTSTEDLGEILSRADVIASLRKSVRDVVKLRPLHEGRKGRRKETEGRFRTFYENTTVPGLYQIEFLIKGVSSQSGVFERTGSRHIIVADKSDRAQSVKKTRIR